MYLGMITRANVLNIVMWLATSNRSVGGSTLDCAMFFRSQFECYIIFWHSHMTCKIQSECFAILVKLSYVLVIFVYYILSWLGRYFLKGFAYSNPALYICSQPAQTHNWQKVRLINQKCHIRFSMDNNNSSSNKKRDFNSRWKIEMASVIEALSAA